MTRLLLASVSTYDSLRSIMRIFESASPCVFDTSAECEVNLSFGITDRQQSTGISWAFASCQRNNCSTVSHCKLFSEEKKTVKKVLIFFYTSLKFLLKCVVQMRLSLL